MWASFRLLELYPSEVERALGVGWKSINGCCVSIWSDLATFAMVVSMTIAATIDWPRRG